MLLQKKIALRDHQIVGSTLILGKSGFVLTNVDRAFMIAFFRPYYSNCFYCHLKYDVIGRLEDFTEDVMYIALRQNLTSLLPDLIKNNRKSKGKSSSDDKVKYYISQLSNHQRKKLLELYKLDFDLFGYDPKITI